MHAGESIQQLIAFVTAHSRLLVLTGAGVSTDSGIPDYRDENGNWKVKQPIQGADFINDEQVRKRYWARSLIGWSNFARAAPNATHRALAALEELGFVQHLITQNVDGLHQRAGSRGVTDLHGRLDRVICLSCGALMPRAALQQQLELRNPDFTGQQAQPAPDGDALLERMDYARLELVDCHHCGGTLKPDVVFFGENVPAERVRFSMRRLQSANALLVVGSSLMVFSGFRFCLEAQRLGLPIGAVNLGRTRADGMLALKVSGSCTALLPALVQHLG